MGDRTVLDHHLDRLAWSELPVVVATTSNDTDDEIVSLATKRGLPVYRGSENDVLSRFVGAASSAGLDAIVRVTSDCPLIDGSVIDEAVDSWLAMNNPFAYMANTLTRTFPRGFDFEIFSLEGLRIVDRLAQRESEREHVTSYMYRDNDSGFSRHSVERSRKDGAENLRLTLDTREDYNVLRALIEDFDAHLLRAEGVISLAKDHPEIMLGNAEVKQKSS